MWVQMCLKLLLSNIHIIKQTKPKTLVFIDTRFHQLWYYMSFFKFAHINVLNSDIIHYVTSTLDHKTQQKKE